MAWILSSTKSSLGSASHFGLSQSFCQWFCCEFGKKVIPQGIKSRIGFVVGFLRLNPSEALTNRWGQPHMHFSSLSSWSSVGKEIVAPRDVRCKCNSLLGILPWKLEGFLLFSYTWSASHPHPLPLLPTQDADPCMSVAFSWWRCHPWIQNTVPCCMSVCL